MVAKLIITVALLGIANGAAAHPLPTAAKAHAARKDLDDIIGEVQLDALIARIVPADAAKHAAPGHRAYASATPTKAHDRS